MANLNSMLDYARYANWVSIRGQKIKTHRFSGAAPTRNPSGSTTNVKAYEFINAGGVTEYFINFDYFNDGGNDEIFQTYSTTAIEPEA